MNSKILIRMNLLNNSFEKFMNYQDKEYSILIKYLILDFKSFFVNMVMWCMAPVVKRLRPRIVVPICMGSNPIRRPIKYSVAFATEYFI